MLMKIGDSNLNSDGDLFSNSKLGNPINYPIFYLF